LQPGCEPTSLQTNSGDQASCARDRDLDLVDLGHADLVAQQPHRLSVHGLVED
jgi:hypothetical protein